ncbi:MAG TPA: hydroxysqualene dehydroxylase HpnE, partial [Gemmataceae bacterium]|nr:hydroxysqualene dehydroxylase HpnE [Gemmataceae bacterium]
MDIAVIGGGISGIRAALSLARSGRRVTLFEKNRHLGGRVFSFPTAEFGEIDIGQHVWLKCCTALERLLADLGVPDDWVYRQRHFAMTYKRPGAADFVFASSALPGLLHALPGLLRFPGLGGRDLVRLSWGMARARLYTARGLEALDAISFTEWLRRHRQTPAAVARLWEPIVLGICNGRPEEVSARHALFTFRESLLKSKHAADFCFLRRPLSAVFDRRAREALTAAGVEPRLGTAVRAVRPGSPPAVVFAGSEERCGRVVLALPLKRQRALLGDECRLPEPPPDGPIAGLLLKFAAPVTDELFFMAVDSPVQIVFNKTAIWEAESSTTAPQLVEAVISGAAREARLGVARVTAELLPELVKLLPRAATTPVLAARLLVHGGATFGVPPGREAGRLPPLRPDCPGVVFAGDEAATGWPSTMESAARAGEAAARAVLVSPGTRIASAS